MYKYLYNFIIMKNIVPIIIADTLIIILGAFKIIRSDQTTKPPLFTFAVG